MANIPSAGVYMNDVEVAFEAALSEQLFTKLGANINYLLDSHTSQASSISTINSTLSNHESRITTRETALGSLLYTKNQNLGTLSTNQIVFNDVQSFSRTTKALICIGPNANTFTDGAATGNTGRISLIHNGVSGYAYMNLILNGSTIWTTRNSSAWQQTSSAGIGYGWDFHAEPICIPVFSTDSSYTIQWEFRISASNADLDIQNVNVQVVPVGGY